jgi:hypothetical protein
MACDLCAQTPGRRRGDTKSQQANPIGSTGAYHEPAATMRGVLKRMTSKQIFLLVENDETAAIYRTKKTKFLEKGHEIDPTKIKEGTALAIDVGKDPDLNPVALNVMIEGSPE